MNKGFTLVELLTIILLIILILWCLFLVFGKDHTKCYMTTEGIICTFGKIGSDEK